MTAKQQRKASVEPLQRKLLPDLLNGVSCGHTRSQKAKQSYTESAQVQFARCMSMSPNQRAIPGQSAADL